MSNPGKNRHKRGKKRSNIWGKKKPDPVAQKKKRTFHRTPKVAGRKKRTNRKKEDDPCAPREEES